MWRRLYAGIEDDVCFWLERAIRFDGSSSKCAVRIALVRRLLVAACERNRNGPPAPGFKFRASPSKMKKLGLFLR